MEYLDTTDKTHSQSKYELQRHHKKCLQQYKIGKLINSKF